LSVWSLLNLESSDTFWLSQAGIFIFLLPDMKPEYKNEAITKTKENQNKLIKTTNTGKKVRKVHKIYKDSVKVRQHRKKTHKPVKYHFAWMDGWEDGQIHRHIAPTSSSNRFYKEHTLQGEVLH